MKKLTILIALIALVAGVNAQITVNKSMLSSNGYLNDTLTNTETAYFTTPILTDYNNVLSLSVLVTQKTGTSAGTVILQATLDGTNWVTINTTNTTTIIVTTNDTLTITNAAYNIWTLIATPYRQYRLKVAQTGTSTTTYGGYLFIKNQ